MSNKIIASLLAVALVVVAGLTWQYCYKTPTPLRRAVAVCGGIPEK